jgi:hypothetical protein
LFQIGRDLNNNDYQSQQHTHHRTSITRNSELNNSKDCAKTKTATGNDAVSNILLSRAEPRSAAAAAVSVFELQRLLALSTGTLSTGAPTLRNAQS